MDLVSRSIVEVESQPIRRVRRFAFDLADQGEPVLRFGRTGRQENERAGRADRRTAENQPSFHSNLAFRLIHGTGLEPRRTGL